MQQAPQTTNRLPEKQGHTKLAQVQILHDPQGRQILKRSSQGQDFFYKLTHAQGDRDCFFHAINRPGLTRASLSEKLLAEAPNGEVRAAFAAEIHQFLYVGATQGHEDPDEQQAYEKLVTEEFLLLARRIGQFESKIQELVITVREELGEAATKGKKPSELVSLLRERNSPLTQPFSSVCQAVLDANQEVNEYCSREAVFANYVQYYLKEARGFISFTRKFGGEEVQTTIDVISRLFQTNIQVFLRDGTRITTNRPEPSIPIFHNGIDHFSGLEPQPEGEALSRLEPSRPKNLFIIGLENEPTRGNFWTKERLANRLGIGQGASIEDLLKEIETSEKQLLQKDRAQLWIKHYQVAKLHADLADFKQAALAYQKALDVMPKVPSILAGVHQDIGCCYHAMGEIEQAQEHFNQAIALHRSSRILCEQGHFMLASGRHQEAIPLLKEASQLIKDPECVVYTPSEAGRMVDFIRPFLQQHDDRAPINASFFAALLLSYISLEQGLFQKSWDWQLTLEEWAKQEPSHIFLLELLEKKLADKMLEAVADKANAICLSLENTTKELADTIPWLAQKIDKTTAACQAIDRLLEASLASTQPLSEQASSLIRQQISRLHFLESKIEACELEKKLQKPLLSQLKELRFLNQQLLMEQTVKQEAGFDKQELNYKLKIAHLATYLKGEQAFLSGRLEIAIDCLTHVMKQVHECDKELIWKSALCLGQIYLSKNTKDDCVKASGLFNYAYNLSSRVSKAIQIQPEQKKQLELAVTQAQQILLMCQSAAADSELLKPNIDEMRSLRKTTKWLTKLANSENPGSRFLHQRLGGQAGSLTSAQRACVEKISLAQRQMIELCTGQPSQVSAQELRAIDLGNKQHLERIRTSISARIPVEKSEPETVRALFEEIAGEMKGFLATLFEQCTRICGLPECPYALIALGSLARHETTPYSDLEFAFLIQEERNTSEVVQRFKNITYLMYVQVLNLGETILPGLNIAGLGVGEFHDDVTARGIAFDGGGVSGKGHKTPLGQKERKEGARVVAHEFELIQTPIQMAQFLGKSQKYEEAYWLELEPHLPMELINVDLVKGESSLIEDYRKALVAVLERPYKGAPLREQYALRQLVEQDLLHFNPWEQIHLAKEGRLLRAKGDLYRLPHLTLDRFALFSSIFSSSTWEKISRLQAQGTISWQGAKNLEWLLSETMKFRLIAYSQAKRQRETLNPLLNPFVDDDPKRISRYFDLNHDSLNALTNVYQVLLPLYGAMEQFAREEGLGCLRMQSFRTESSEDLGKIAMRLMQHEKAREHFLHALVEGNYGALNGLGHIDAERGNFVEALESYQKFTNRVLAQHHQGLSEELDLIDAEIAIAKIYRKMGKHLETQEKLNELENRLNARSAEKKSPEEQERWQGAKKGVGNEQGLLASELGDSERAVGIFNLLLAEYPQDDEKLFFQSNLALADSKLGTARAREHLQEAFRISREMYPDEHPSQSIILNNLGRSYTKTHEWHKARECFVRAFKILRQLNHESPSLEASLFIGIGGVEMNCSRYQEAETCFKKALAIVLQRATDHVLLQGEIYLGLGTNNERSGKLQEASGYFRASLEVMLQKAQLPGVNRIIVKTLFQQVEVLLKLSRLKEAKRCLEQILKTDKAMISPINKIRASIQKGQILHEEARLDEALEAFQNAHRIYNAHIETLQNDERSLVIIENVAMGYTAAGRHEEAAQLLEDLLGRFGQNPDRRQIVILNDLGVAYGRLGDSVDSREKALDCRERALQSYERALGLSRTLLENDPHMMINLLCNKGLCLDYLGRVAEGAACLAQALQLAQSSNFRLQREYHSLLGSAVELSLNNNDFASALTHLAEQLKIANERFGENDSRTIDVRFQLGEVYFKLGRWEEALEHDLLALGHFLDRDTFGQYGILIYRIVHAYQSIGKFSQAILHSEKLLKAYDDLAQPKDSTYWECLLHLTEMSQEQGDVENAKSGGLKGLRLLETLAQPQPHLKARFLIRLCLIHLDERVRNSSEAKKYLDELEASGIIPKLDDYQTCLRLARVLLLMRDYDRAEEFALRAERLMPSRSDYSAVAEAANLYVQLAQICEARDELESNKRSLEYYNKALHLFATNTSFAVPRFKILNNLGLLLGRMDDLEGAITKFEEALKLSRSLPSEHASPLPTMCNQITYYIKQGKFEEANKRLQEAQEACNGSRSNPINASLVLNCQAKLRQQEGKLGEAIATFQQVLAMVQGVLGPSHPKMATLHKNLGLAYQQQGSLEAARRSFSNGYQILQRAGMQQSDEAKELLKLLN